MRGYCVIGKSLAHSLSPELHRLFGTDDYAIRELNEEEIEGFVAAREYAGYNVTIPFKRSVMEYLDRIDGVALEVGAVNTVVEEDGKLVGYNTDVGGMTGALKRAGIEIQGKSVMILGSGGASKCAQYIARRQGARDICVVSRTGDINYANCYERTDAQVIINTTPVGMYPDMDASPVDLSRFGALEGVFDAVYNPLTTRLIMQANALGIPAANGLYMLVEQGRLAHNLFMRAAGLSEADEKNSTQVHKMLLSQLKNITLIGMSGSGKTIIGKNLALALQRDFYDTDRMVEKAAGKSIPQIFEEDGEEVFRRYEREAVREACGGLGRVISSGGGAALDERNMFYIKANGLAVWVMRDPDKLSVNGRPLTKTPEDAIRLSKARMPIYQKAADKVVENNSDVVGAVLKIAAFLEEE